MKRIAAVVAVAVVAATAYTAAPVSADAPETISVESPGLAFVHLAEETETASTVEQPQSTSRDSPSSAPAATSSFLAPSNGDFVFHHDPDVTETMRAAFEAAAGIWSQVLEVEVPIVVGVSVESFPDPGILGGAAPGDLFANHPSFPTVGTWYVSALANQFAGRDLDAARDDVSVVISRDYDFYEGIDERVPSDQVSLLALALHELGHGLGHTTLAHRLPDGTGVLDYQGLPLSYDRLIRTSASVPLSDLSPRELGQALTRETGWGGAEGTRRNGGTAPKLYSPSYFEPGSSISHLDEGHFTNALMTPFLAKGEAQMSVPELTQGMFADFGWGLEARTPAEALVTAVSRDFIKRFPTPTELGRLSASVEDGTTTRRQLADAFGLHDASIARVVDRHYLAALDRLPDPSEKLAASARIRAGEGSAHLLARLLASSERFTTSGGTLDAWIAALYRDVLGREPDDVGQEAWITLADAWESRTAIALRFVQSEESRARRVTESYRRLLGREPDAAGLVVWTAALQSRSQLGLEIRLASTTEYEDRSVRRFG